MSAINDLLKRFREKYLPEEYERLAAQLVPGEPDFVDLAHGERVAMAVFEKVRLAPSEFRQLPLVGKVVWLRRALEGEDAPADDSTWVSVGEVWRDQFPTYKQFRSFLKQHPEIRRRNPTSQRLEIHSGDWLRYWNEVGRRGFQDLDRAEGRRSIADDPACSEAFLAGAIERMNASRERKRQGK